MVISLGRIFLNSLALTNVPRGTFIYLYFWLTDIVFSMLRPKTITFRLCWILASIICFTRWTFEANVEIIILPLILPNIVLMLSPIFFSEKENLLTWAFVESDSKHNTPASAYRVSLP